MTKLLTLVLVPLIWQSCVGPPVTKTKEEQQMEEENIQLTMHYQHYLKEVVGALESDPEFKKKLEGAEEADIRSGKIAHELEFVSHHVRTRLDEIKRQELDRLRTLTKQKQQLSDNEVVDDPTHGHLDRTNPHTFEIDDLKKLITKTTEDLAEADRKRREEFKQYELRKEYEKQEKINHTNGDEHDKLVKEYEELEMKHKKHDPLHEPGHKAQLEEVWEEQDQMQQEFDPKAFFMMHDLDSNGLWDENEVKALFVKELDKMYAAGAPEDDMKERLEEMERMRETVFQEVDLNRDGFIDYREFFAQTKKQEFQQDHGWKGLDEQSPYTDEELQSYINHQQQMMQHGMPPPGYRPPPPGQYPQAGYHPNQVYQQPQPHHAPPPQLNTNEVYHNQQPPQVPRNYQGQMNHPQQGNNPPPQVNQHQQEQVVEPNQNQGPPPAANRGQISNNMVSEQAPQKIRKGQLNEPLAPNQNAQEAPRVVSP